MTQEELTAMVYVETQRFGIGSGAFMERRREIMGLADQIQLNPVTGTLQV